MKRSTQKPETAGQGLRSWQWTSCRLLEVLEGELVQSPLSPAVVLYWCSVVHTNEAGCLQGCWVESDGQP